MWTPTTVLATLTKRASAGSGAFARLNLADSLKLIVGTRVSWYRYWNSSGVQTMKESGVVSPYGGIVYDLNRQWSLYASYSDIFNPQTVLDRKGNVLSRWWAAITRPGSRESSSTSA
jgi:outer membrane receptor for ferric coprogen and ferric-rhodotorulic acid